jgi:hypothetical protein
MAAKRPRSNASPSHGQTDSRPAAGERPRARVAPGVVAFVASSPPVRSVLARSQTRPRTHHAWAESGLAARSALEQPWVMSRPDGPSRAALVGQVERQGWRAPRPASSTLCSRVRLVRRRRGSLMSRTNGAGASVWRVGRTRRRCVGVTRPPLVEVLRGDGDRRFRMKPETSPSAGEVSVKGL